MIHDLQLLFVILLLASAEEYIDCPLFKYLCLAFDEFVVQDIDIISLNVCHVNSVCDHAFL